GLLNIIIMFSEKNQHLVPDILFNGNNLTFSNYGICECNNNEPNENSVNEADQREAEHFTRSALPIPGSGINNCQI
ncbi:MAG: hypothetical protein ACRC2T_03535, partial [Thermoguttaceae bacterium]